MVPYFNIRFYYYFYLLLLWKAYTKHFAVKSGKLLKGRNRIETDFGMIDKTLKRPHAPYSFDGQWQNHPFHKRYKIYLFFLLCCNQNKVVKVDPITVLNSVLVMCVYVVKKGPIWHVMHFKINLDDSPKISFVAHTTATKKNKTKENKIVFPFWSWKGRERERFHQGNWVTFHIYWCIHIVKFVYQPMDFLWAQFSCAFQTNLEDTHFTLSHSNIRCHWLLRMYICWHVSSYPYNSVKTISIENGFQWPRISTWV